MVGRLALVCIAALIAPLWAAKRVAPVYKNGETRIQVDGLLSEAAWDEVDAVSDFVEVYPDDSGREAQLITEVRLIYTDRGLYVGFWCQQERSRQIGRLSARDVGAERDWFRVYVDPGGQGAFGYFMELGLGGSRRDGTVLVERRHNNDWDGPWRGRTQTHDNGWTGEMFLPWNMFSMPKTNGDAHEMGLHLERWVAHSGRKYSWEPIYDRDNKFLSGFSRMKVKVNGASSDKLTLYPYAAGDHDQLGDSTSGKGGLDLFWNPTRGLKLSATMFPDFGQVESDDLVVNLGAFETFFPEKRSFFLEDRDIFNTRKYNLVHTRRIGASPDSPEVDDGQNVEGLPGASEIITALKLTGLQGDYRFGVMSAVEEDEDYLVVDDDSGAIMNRGTASGRQFFSGRVMRERTLSSGHYQAIGYLGTLTRRETLERDAMVHAIDGTIRDRDGQWNVNWQALSSFVDEAGESESGFGAWIDGNYQASREWRHYMELVYFDDKIDINDQGFLWRNDQQWLTYNLRQRDNDSERFKELRFDIWTSWARNRAGEMIEGNIWMERVWARHNRTSVALSAEYNPPQWDDRISRDNGSVRMNATGEVGGWWDSDPRRKFGFFTGMWFWTEQEFEDRPSFLIRAHNRYTPNDHLDFRLSIVYRNRDGWLLWDDETTFGAYAADQFTPDFRANVLISNTQDLRIILQWVAIKAETQRVLALGGDGQLREDPTIDRRDLDFAISNIALQARYRYEFSPLSEFYMVYSLGGVYEEEDDRAGLPPLSQLWSDSFRNKTADQFLMKLRYRF